MVLFWVFPAQYRMTGVVIMAAGRGLDGGELAF
jgi:hypothetical protein